MTDTKVPLSHILMVGTTLPQCNLLKFPTSSFNLQHFHEQTNFLWKYDKRAGHKSPKQRKRPTQCSSWSFRIDALSFFLSISTSLSKTVNNIFFSSITIVVFQRNNIVPLHQLLYVTLSSKMRKRAADAAPAAHPVNDSSYTITNRCCTRTHRIMYLGVGCQIHETHAKVIFEPPSWRQPTKKKLLIRRMAMMRRINKKKLLLNHIRNLR